MPGLGDSAFIFVLALLLFGPKSLPKLARQLGKLMAEFRRASNDFRMQMEDELRIAEQEEHQKKVEALVPPPSQLEAAADLGEPAPIAEIGDIKMMPPSTGLPVGSATDWDSTASSNAGVIATPTETILESPNGNHIESHQPVETPVFAEQNEQAAHG